MKHLAIRFSLALLAVVLGSCANDGGEASTTPAADSTPAAKMGGEQAMLDRWAKTNPMYSKDQRGPASENGTADQNFKGELAKRDFKTKTYEKRAFWSQKEYPKTVYNGNTDGSRFQYGAREGTQSAREGTQMSRDNGRQYATWTKRTEAAREAGVAGVSKTSDAEVDARRRVFTQPEILPSAR